jgi:hypothetical protein
MSFRMMDLMVDVTPALFGPRGCPNSGTPKEPGCPNSGPGTGDDFGCPNSGPPPTGEEPGCPNSGPGTGDDLGCPNSGGPTHPGRKGCPNSGVTGPRKRATGSFAAGLPDLRRQLRETLGAQL